MRGRVHLSFTHYDVCITIYAFTLYALASMQIIPAIDIKGGKCVRLRQGEFSQVETYSEDPVKFAMRWEQEGATRLHVVDLDGARIGIPQAPNLDALRQILRRVNIPVQMGGGIRGAEIVE